MSHRIKRHFLKEPRLRQAAEFRRLNDYLKHVRAYKGMSMADIARVSETLRGLNDSISKPILSKIESGAISEPHFSTLVKVAQAYGIELDQLVVFFE